MKEVSIDIDGTLANSMIVFMRILRKEHDIDMRLDEVKRYNLQKVTGIPKPVVREMFSEIWSKPEAIPLISKRIPSVVRRLSEEIGADVKILTGSTAEESDIKRWLRLKGIEYDSFEKLANWREKPFRAGDVHIDDHFTVAELFAKNKRRMLLLEQPWNTGRKTEWKGNEYVAVARDWVHVEKLLANRATSA